MNRISRRTILLFVIVLALALPTTVLANKKLYKANISAGNELHEVVGSSARGSGVFNPSPDGTFHFTLQIRNLSGQVTGLHLHAPATTEQTAGVVLTLCGGPAPAVLGSCPPLDSNNSLVLSGSFNSSYLQPGVTGAQMQQWLDDGLVYINAHTALNPAGEARGQLIPQ
ncbi:MAG: CHRD domain-containing protein [Caldilineaceae bacterium]|nr:CHRD domain-containing protein [Caldilineaceae bacterium]